MFGLTVRDVVLDLIIAVLLGLLIANFFLSNDKNNLLEQCAKQHNVYECELIAVPKEVKP